LLNGASKERRYDALDGQYFQKRHAEVGAEIIASTPEQYHAYLKSELAKFAKLVKAAGIKAAAGG